MLCQLCHMKQVTRTCILCGTQACDLCSQGQLCKNCAEKANPPDKNKIFTLQKS